jgi:hypothetical protein
VASVSVDREADIAVIDVLPGRTISRSERVGRSLLANYDALDALVSVEVLSLHALLRREVLRDLRQLLSAASALAPAAVASPPGQEWLTLRPAPLDVVDSIVQHLGGETVTSADEHLARVLI